MLRTSRPFTKKGSVARPNVARPGCPTSSTSVFTTGSSSIVINPAKKVITGHDVVYDNKHGGDSSNFNTVIMMPTTSVVEKETVCEDILGHSNTGDKKHGKKRGCQHLCKSKSSPSSRRGHYANKVFLHCGMPLPSQKKR